MEAGLSFLGVGVPPPQASWGTLLNDGYVNLGRSVWGVVFPAGMLAVATLGFTLLREAVRDGVTPNKACQGHVSLPHGRNQQKDT